MEQNSNTLLKLQANKVPKKPSIFTLYNKKKSKAQVKDQNNNFRPN